MLSYDLMSEMRHTAKTKKYFTGDMIETAWHYWHVAVNTERIFSRISGEKIKIWGFVEKLKL